MLLLLLLYKIKNTHDERGRKSQNYCELCFNLFQLQDVIFEPHFRCSSHELLYDYYMCAVCYLVQVSVWELQFLQNSSIQNDIFLHNSSGEKKEEDKNNIVYFIINCRLIPVHFNTKQYLWFQCGVDVPVCHSMANRLFELQFLNLVCIACMKSNHQFSHSSSLKPLTSYLNGTDNCG